MASFQPPKLDFIGANPAIAAYDNRLNQEQKRRLDALREEGLLLDNEYTYEAMPSKLKTLEAGSRSATAGADVAEGTVGSRIAASNAGARTATVGAEVAEETKPYTVSKARSGSRLAAVQAGVEEESAPYRVQANRAGAQRATTEADVGAATAPARVSTAQSGSRLAAVNAGVAEQTAPHKVRRSSLDAASSAVKGLKEALDLIDQGDADSAKQILDAYGIDLPESVFSDRAYRSGLAEAWNVATKLYPNNPRAVQQYLLGKKQELDAARAAALPPTVPGGAYTPPLGAPLPPETATRTTGKLQFEAIRDAAIALGYPPQEAFNIALNKKQPSEMEMQNLARQIVAMEMPSGDFRSTPEARRARFNEVVTEMRATMGGASFASRFTGDDPNFMGPPPAPKWYAPPQPQPQPEPSPQFGPERPPPAAPHQDPRRPNDIPVPQRPATVPPGSAYSPSRGMWRDARGNVYDAQGRPVTQ